MRFLVTLLALLSFEILLAGSARTAFAQGQSAPSNFQFEQFTSILAKTVSMSWRTPSSMQTLHSFPWQHHLCVSPCCSTLISNAPLRLQWSNVTSRDPSELRRLPSTLPQTPNPPRTLFHHRESINQSSFPPLPRRFSMRIPCIWLIASTIMSTPTNRFHLLPSQREVTRTRPCSCLRMC